MKCARLIAAICIMSGVQPGSISAQDWTFEVPLQLERLAPEVEGVEVVCSVSALDPPRTGDVSDEFTFLQLQFGGDAIVGTSVVVPVESNGTLNTVVTVEVDAPDGMTDEEKWAATTWACRFGVTGVYPVVGPPVEEGSAGQDVPFAKLARDGSLTHAVAGRLPGRDS